MAATNVSTSLATVIEETVSAPSLLDKAIEATPVREPLPSILGEVRKGLVSKRLPPMRRVIFVDKDSVKRNIEGSARVTSWQYIPPDYYATIRVLDAGKSKADPYHAAIIHGPVSLGKVDEKGLSSTIAIVTHSEIEVFVDPHGKLRHNTLLDGCGCGG